MPQPIGRYRAESLWEIGRFLPAWRGRVLQDQPALDPTRVRQLVLLIAGRQEGDFFLAIRTIGFEIATP
ncbi:CIA30 family protein [Aromatoleum buckelii]|uniref:NADH:ubiquinone oxidoreductase intermediate-associated protein 30 domain-containing protein n=1 Tax=Aromatoleum buckelii TaxID=200254 RepID=A0ABX1N411_9RHOO